MINQLIALIVDESKWLTASMSFAMLAVTILLYGYRHSDLSAAPFTPNQLATVNPSKGTAVRPSSFRLLRLAT